MLSLGLGRRQRKYSSILFKIDLNLHFFVGAKKTHSVVRNVLCTQESLAVKTNNFTLRKSHRAKKAFVIATLLRSKI